MMQVDWHRCATITFGHEQGELMPQYICWIAWNPLQDNCDEERISNPISFDAEDSAAAVRHCRLWSQKNALDALRMLGWTQTDSVTITYYCCLDTPKLRDEMLEEDFDWKPDEFPTPEVMTDLLTGTFRSSIPFGN